MNIEIYERLKSIARAEEVTNYTEIGQMADLDMESPSDRNRISEILDEINRYEHSQGRPLLTALVIRQDINMPGEGFFTLARELKKLTDDDELVFWAHELTEVHECWKVH